MLKYLKDKSKKAYALGPVENIEDYLKDRYKEKPIFIRGNILDLPKFTMKRLDQNKKHCSLTAITRIMKYYKLKGYKDIPDSEEDIYRTVKEKGFRRLGYFSLIGTLPFRVSSIVRASFKSYGYRVRSRGRYMWNFYDDIVAEIDQDRPLIFNIMRGYYRKHTITVVGYKIYSIKGDIKHILIVQDGWNYSLRFIDFNDFRSNLLFAGIGSFNKIKIL